MSEYSAKNYTEQGGEVTHIGGKLAFDEGASMTGFPGVINMKPVEGSQVKDVKEGLNALITGLKNAGIMIPDTWNISAGLAPAPTEEEGAANNRAVEDVTLADDIVTVTVSLDDLTAFPSSNPEQGTHKWIALEIGTGIVPITGASYNGYAFEESDIADAQATGCAEGSFVLYIKAEEVAVSPKEFTLDSDGYAPKKITILIVEPQE